MKSKTQKTLQRFLGHHPKIYTHTHNENCIRVCVCVLILCHKEILILSHIFFFCLCTGDARQWTSGNF